LIKCPTCGSENEGEAAFCGTCGAVLEAVGASPGSDTVVPEATKPSAESASSAAVASAEVTDGADAVSETRMEVVQAAPPDIRKDPWAAAGGTAGAGSGEDETACPTCGTLNPVSRDFCRKCATELRPGPVVKRSRVNKGLVARFLVSAVVGTAVVVTGAFVLTRIGPASASVLPSAAAIDLIDPSGVPVEFDVQPGEPEPLPALPATAHIQLASYEEPTATEGPGGGPTPGRAQWWSDALPRIPAVSQFDGGPLQRVNCVMAAGAMLARLAYGIVTTGSQLRALSGDPEGGTSFGNLQDAVDRGWGVKFSMGALTPLQLRALLYAGAGAEVIVVYGAIPVSTRLQASFTGNHAIYIDAFSPDALNGKPAYYVMDPIGRTWEGYKGEWWAAEEVERAGMAFGRGRVATTWAFAGGKIPFNHPRLPVSAYPSNEPPPSRGPGSTAGPGSTDGPLGTAVPGVDPMPTADLPLDDGPVIGDPPPPDEPRFPKGDFFTNVYEMYPSSDGGSACTAQPPPAGCPSGIIGIIDLLGGTLVSGTSPPREIDLMYANPIAPDTYQIIYTSPIDSSSSLLLWESSGGGTLEAAKVESGYLNGTEIKIATITVDPNVEYSFLATTETDGIRSISDVGSLLLTP
jgi:hypothetical protein